MRLAAIDVGTNTVLLTVGDVEDGALTVLADEERFARLGQGVDASGRLADEAMDRVMDRLAASKDVAANLGAERIVIGATSASRDASNVHVLIDRVRRELGLDYRVISGEMEAVLSFRGALVMLPGMTPGAPAVVIDVGGGSTEFVAGAAGFAPAHRVSVDIGSVRLRERSLPDLPAPADAIAAALDVAERAFADIPEQIARVRPVVGVAGTARVAAVLARRAGAEARGAAESGEVVTTAAVREWRDRLLGMSSAEALALDQDLMSGRADVAGVGLMILVAALERCGASEFTFSVGGLRHGLLLASSEGSI